MALQGTLRDFGIAEILQLVGQQQKSGTLRVKSKKDEVLVGFKDGTIVKAESASRKRKDLIGNRLVRAELITEAQLASALENQKRTLRRLGDVLVSMGAISQERFRQMVQLQAQEAIFQLFSWKSGSYAFEPGEVEHDPTAMDPLRPDAVLMDGFRMMDEWPLIRKVISNDAMTFEIHKQLPSPPAGGGDDFNLSFGDEPEESPQENKGEFQSLGASERRLFGLVKSGREVRKLLDLSCLGEFDTLKALLNLVNLGYLKPVPAKASAAVVRFQEPSFGPMVRAALSASLALFAVGGLAYLGFRLELHPLAALGASAESTLSDPALQRFVARAQMGRIEAALEVYRAERGEFPEKLEALVREGLVAEEDLKWPWQSGYYYRRTSAQGFVLLPPFR